LRGFAKKSSQQDTEMVASLGFFDEGNDEKRAAPLDPLFS